MASSSRAYSESSYASHRSGAGTITRIRLENFMCHSSLHIELGEWVNFITGQNGSGKSAILTAICIAFGCRAKGTQRAATLKDFIKTGCSYAMVQVELKNQGGDAFKHEIYGDSIIIERRITETSSPTALKDSQGKKVASRRQELNELIDHFNIDVENPCVVMSQDKSREFLHSGNDKDKFKFFFKATLLQQVNDLLCNIEEHLNTANAVVSELEKSIAPIQAELRELQQKIKYVERVEEISQQVHQLKKKLAWSWVYDVDKQLEDQNVKIAKLKDRIPACQAKIDFKQRTLEKLRDRLAEKKAEIAVMVEKTSEIKRRKDELNHHISLAKQEKIELEGEYDRKTNYINKQVKRFRFLEQQVQDIHEQDARNTQAEVNEMKEKLKELESEVDAAKSTLSRLKEEENELSENLYQEKSEIRKLVEEIEAYERKYGDIKSHIGRLQLSQTNKVTAFGGDKVIELLRLIEKHHARFNKPPIGPIGVHLSLVNGDIWANAVEQAIGRVLNAFIVTDHKDALLLRRCAKDARYNNLQIYISDFSRPRLNVPNHMLPQTKHPTVLSLLQSDNPTVINVLVDMASAERLVLVKDYDMGKAVAFEQKVPNLKEVYTLDGHKMFSRGSVQTILPLKKNLRTGRLCSSYDELIKDLENEALAVQQEAEGCRKRKRELEGELQGVQHRLQSVKRNRTNADRIFNSRDLELRDAKKLSFPEPSASSASTVDELSREISKVHEEIQEKKSSLEKLQGSMNEAHAKVKDLKLSFENLCESAKEDIKTFEDAEKELMEIEKDLQSSEAEKNHYENVMNNKVIPDIKEAELQYQELEQHRKESCRKASIICPESEIEALGGLDDSTPEQLSAHLNKLNQRLQEESQLCSESIDDLKMMYEKKERKISRKQLNYKVFREKLHACQKAVSLRRSKFERNEELLKRQLTWRFNHHLGRKGVSGHIKINYNEKTLAIEVKMPQDSSSSVVRDTRGLSGGERSFSTLCFALALHEMTEAPFRAMDEFDVFMDAVSRKISLDTLVDFALEQGSQWVFITPHDISLVKQADRIKKQQMAAPRP